MIHSAFTEARASRTSAPIRCFLHCLCDWNRGMGCPGIEKVRGKRRYKRSDESTLSKFHKKDKISAEKVLGL